VQHSVVGSHCSPNTKNVTQPVLNITSIFTLITNHLALGKKMPNKL